MLIVYAEDNEGDRRLAKLAAAEAALDCEILCVEDGQQLLEYLHGKGADAGSRPERPDLLLIDLNMPRKGGLEALAEIKSDPDLWKIPAIVLTSSKSEADIFSAYDAGATSYVVKPASFEALVEAMKVFGKWWLETVTLPSEKPEVSRRILRL